MSKVPLDKRYASEAELNEQYAKFVEALAKVEDPETKQHVIELIENGFAPFDLETLGKLRDSR